MSDYSWCGNGGVPLDESEQAYLEHIAAAERLQRIALALSLELRHEKVVELVNEARHCLQVCLMNSDFLSGVKP